MRSYADTSLFVAVTSFDLTARQQVDVVETMLDALKRRDELPVLAPGALARWLEKDSRRS
jgi:hypothetical protein